MAIFAMALASLSCAPSVDNRASDLAPIPWEGGPGYYSQFPRAAVRGWTDPGFFPIGVWFESVITQEDVDADKEIGLNTYVVLTQDSNLELVRKNGMSAILSQLDMPNVGEETVGWLIDDEPEQHGQPQVEERLNRLKQQIADAYPNDGRFRYTNFTGNMVFPAYTSGDDVSSRWLDVSDVSSLDVYWYSRALWCGGNIAGEVWKDGSGPPQAAGAGYNDLSPAECFRPSNYGYVIEKMREIDAVNSRRQPLYAFVENGHPFELGDPTITPDQMAGAVWSSLIHGARGINYFNHSYSGPCTSSHDFREPVIGTRGCFVDIRAKAKEINLQIKQLAPVLNTQSLTHTFDTTLDTMLKFHDGSYYIFAMPSGIKGGSAIGNHKMVLPADAEGSTVEVLFEGRSIPVAPDRTFADNFERDTTYHIYKVTP